MLVLSHSNAFGIDLHQLRQGIHQPPSNGNGSADRHIIIRKFLPGYLGCGIDGGARFIDHIYLHVVGKAEHPDKPFGLPAGGAISYGNGLDLVLLHQRGNFPGGSCPVLLGGMRIDGGIVQQVALLITAHFEKRDQSLAYKGGEKLFFSGQEQLDRASFDFGCDGNCQ